MMASTSFNTIELPFLREIVWYGQQMAKISNWLSTWKREVKRGNFTSGVFSYLVSGLIFPYELIDLNENEVTEVVEMFGVHDYLIKLWKENYEKIKVIRANVKSIDVDLFLNGLEKLLKFHLVTEM